MGSNYGCRIAGATSASLTGAPMPYACGSSAPRRVSSSSDRRRLRLPSPTSAAATASPTTIVDLPWVSLLQGYCDHGARQGGQPLRRAGRAVKVRPFREFCAAAALGRRRHQHRLLPGSARTAALSTASRGWRTLLSDQPGGDGELAGRRPPAVNQRPRRGAAAAAPPPAYWMRQGSSRKCRAGGRRAHDARLPPRGRYRRAWRLFTRSGAASTHELPFAT